jgi:hypothetical protein
MVVLANSSFLESPEFSSVSGSRSFFWTMVALAALDIILLFWILNPLSRPVDYLHSAKLSGVQVESTLGNGELKRSPLGSIATRVAPKTNRSRGNFTTVAYGR